MVTPNGIRDERQADAGLFQLGTPIARAASRHQQSEAVFGGVGRRSYPVDAEPAHRLEPLSAPEHAAILLGAAQVS